MNDNNCEDDTPRSGLRDAVRAVLAGAIFLGYVGLIIAQWW